MGISLESLSFLQKWAKGKDLQVLSIIAVPHGADAHSLILDEGSGEEEKIQFDVEGRVALHVKDAANNYFLLTPWYESCPEDGKNRIWWNVFHVEAWETHDSPTQLLHMGELEEEFTLG